MSAVPALPHFAPHPADQNPSASLMDRFFASFDRHPVTLDENGEPEPFLKKRLAGYHSQLIALGSAIGTGLFIGSGRGLAIAGPIPLLGAFAFVGFTLCPTIFALGEMATLFPYAGGFFEHCRLFTGEAWGGAMGWNYVIQWLIALPLELVAATITLQYWGKPLGHRAVWITLFLFTLAFINVFTVRGYGNVEAALSVLKVIAILGFIMFGVLRDLGLGWGGDALGVSFWYNPGAVNNGFWGFCSVLITAAFAYSGSEVVGLTAPEQENPKRDMPRAIKQVFVRIGIFYILSILLIGVLVAHDDPSLVRETGGLTSAASPFVIALKNAGVSGLPHIVNGVILITVLSVANSSVYGSSRVLNAMASAGLAPKAFAYIDTKGRLLRCLYLSFAFALLGFLTEISEQATVFIWLVSICGLSNIISWTSICWAHIRFRKALQIHNKPVSSLPYESPLGVWGSWIGLICNLFILLCQILNGILPVDYETMSAAKRAQHFFQSCMAFIIILIFYIGFKRYKGTEISGISLSWKGLSFDNPQIKWGEGTQKVDLSSYVEHFRETWNEGSYIKWARDHPDDIIKLERLWWCPAPLRPLITFFDFPWRSASEGLVEERENERREADRVERERVRNERLERIREEEDLAIETEIERRVEERWNQMGAYRDDDGDDDDYDVHRQG